MRPTRRGWGTLALVAVVFLLAALAGPRSLNAIAAPLLAAFVVGAAQVALAGEPTVTVESPRPGFPDERRSLAIDLEGVGLATVELTLPEGLGGRDVDAAVDLPATIEREVTLLARGIHDVGPVTVRQRGPLGLVGRDVEAPPAGEAVVYPARYTVAGTGFASLFSEDPAAERQEFDRLREYVPGDPLRDIHWKSSAKHDDFLVMEFSAGQRRETVTIAASATPGNADAMASAAATVAELALEADRSVAVTLPDDSLAPGQGPSHRAGLLRLLAGAGPGSVPESVAASADVAIHATDDETTVRAGEDAYTFDAVRTGRMVAGGHS